MATTLSITVTDAQAIRATTAFGHQDTDPTSPTFGQWLPATTQNMRDFIKAWVKAKVIDYETTLTAQEDRNTRSAEVW